MNHIIIPRELRGSWKNISVESEEIKIIKRKAAKFLDREKNIKIHLDRLRSDIPEFLRQKVRTLDVGCGNGATLEILRCCGHDVVGMDYTGSTTDWLYKPLIESQNLKCVIHSGSHIPYPFKNNEFDLLICYGTINSFKNPVLPWVEILNEFSRITKKCILLGVNIAPEFFKEEKNLDNWGHNNFELKWKHGTIYKWVKNENICI